MTEPLVGPGAASSDNVEEEALAALEDTSITEGLAVLTTAQREVVLLRVLGGLSVAEVAKVLGKREGAVRGLQHRGLERLRRHLVAGDAISGERERGTGAGTGGGLP